MNKLKYTDDWNVEVVVEPTGYLNVHINTNGGKYITKDKLVILGNGSNPHHVAIMLDPNNAGASEIDVDICFTTGNDPNDLEIHVYDLNRMSDRRGHTSHSNVSRGNCTQG